MCFFLVYFFVGGSFNPPDWLSPQRWLRIAIAHNADFETPPLIGSLVVATLRDSSAGLRSELSWSCQYGSWEFRWFFANPAHAGRCRFGLVVGALHPGRVRIGTDL